MNCGGKMDCCSQSEARELQKDLQNEYGYSLPQMVEVAGLGSATAIIKNYPLESLTKSKGTVLVVCGPGYNGAVGLVCARYLRIFDYRPTIFYPRRATSSTLYGELAEQCQLQHIPFLSYMPSEAHLITSAYNVIVDALFGCGFRGPTPELDMAAVIQTMIKSNVPIASIDIPSGWTVDSDELQLDQTEDVNTENSSSSPTTKTSSGSCSDDVTGQLLKPDTLVSLTAPKHCSRAFRGRCHCVVHRFLPPELMRKYKLGTATDVDSAVSMFVQLNLVELDATTTADNTVSSQ